MKQLLSFIKKEVLHILRDKRTILILLIMPVVQIMLFGFAMTMEVKNIKVKDIQEIDTHFSFFHYTNKNNID